MSTGAYVPDGCRRCIRLAPAGTCSAPRDARLADLESIVWPPSDYGHRCPGHRTDPTEAIAVVRRAAAVMSWPAHVMQAWMHAAEDRPDPVRAFLEWEMAA